MANEAHTVPGPPLLNVHRNPIQANGIAYRLAPGSTARIEGRLLLIENEWSGEKLAVAYPFDSEYTLILAGLHDAR